MAINESQKVDWLWKKLGYGVAKTDVNSVKAATNESIASPLLIRGDIIWQDAASIPTNKPAATTTVVGIYDDSGFGTATVETTQDATATPNRTWKTNQDDWISSEFGSTYQVKVYLDNTGAAAPQTTGTQLFAAGSGNNDEWFFDYQSGVLNFIGDNLPGGISGKKIYVVGARYVGNKGGNQTSANIANFTFNGNTIGISNLNGDIILDPNGTGNLTVITDNMIIDGSGALVIPVGTTAQRPTPNAQGMIRYNTTDATFEGFDGANWGSLGGVKDVDGDTYIVAETGAGTDNDQLDFYTAGTQRFQIGATGDFKFGDTLTEVTIAGATGDTVIGGTLDAGNSTLSSAIVSDLTDNRIVIAGTAGLLEDDANFTFDGTELAVGVTNFTVAQATGNVYTAGNLVVTGDFTVNGTQTTVNSNTVTIDDPIFTLGGDTAPATDDNKDRGIEFNYFDTTAKVGFFGFDDNTGHFTFIPDATNTSEVFSGTTGELDAKMRWANLLDVPSTALNDTTYNISAETNAGGTNLRLTDSNAVEDDVLFANGTNVTIARTDDSTITISSIDTITNAFNEFTVTDTDTGFTWTETGTALADATTGELTFVSGTDINVDVDATSDAIRFTNTSTLDSVTGRGSVTTNGISVNTLTSTVATGDAPLVVASTTLVTNLNADLLDGQEGTYYLDWTNTTNKPDPVITLGGDLSGNVTLTDLTSGTLNATINANSVALGTDTTGNYVATIAGTANEIEVTGSGTETSAVTIGLPSTITTNVTGNLTGNVTGTTSSISNHSTTDLAEGTNLYYTNARADARIAAASIDDLTDVDITTAAPTNNQVLVWDNANSKFIPGDAASDFTDLTGTIAASQIPNSIITREMLTPTNVFSQEFTANGSTTAFTLSADPGSKNAIQVFVDGVPQRASNYTVVGTTLTLGGTPVNGQVVEVRGYGIGIAVGTVADDSITGPKLQDGTITADKISSAAYASQTFTGDNSTTAFTLNNDPGTAQALLVIVENVIQEPIENYTTSGTTLTFTGVPALNARIYVRYLGLPLNNTTPPNDSVTNAKLNLTYTSNQYTGDNTTTDFTIASGHTVNSILVVLDGSILPPADYSVSGTTLTFGSAPLTSQSIDIRYMPV